MAVQLGSVSSIGSFVPSPRTRENKTTEVHAKSETAALDVISQLNANISQLEDLHGRLRFMMTEIEKLARPKTKI